MSTSKTALSRDLIESVARSSGKAPINLWKTAPRVDDILGKARYRIYPDMIGHNVPRSSSAPNWSGAFSRQAKDWDAHQAALRLKNALSARRNKLLLGGGAALGALGLGAGGYALYRHHKNKQQQEAPKTASEQGYQDFLEKIGLLGGLFKRQAASMPMAGPVMAPRAVSESNAAVDAVRSMYGNGPAPLNRAQQFDAFMANRGTAPAQTMAQQVAASGIKPPTASGSLNIGHGIVPAAGEAVQGAAGAAKPGGLLSGRGGKVLGGLALAGGAAYLYNKYRQQKQMQQAQPQQYYGDPQQMGMPAMQGGY